MKRGTLILIVIVILGLAYWCNKPGGESSDNTGNTTATNENDKGRGCDIDKKEFEKADIFTRLDPNSPKNQLPSEISLRRFAPTPQNQGEQSSCVGWSSCYAARTILQSVAGETSPNTTAFSPAYIYNQIHEGSCMNGTFINEALDKMKAEGVLPLSQFPYDERSCDQKPDGRQRQEAGNYKIKGYNRLTTGQSFDIDIVAMKQNLAKLAPVLIAMPVGGSIFRGVPSNGLWQPTQNDYSRLEEFKGGNYENSGLGGHAMCVIGYDNSKFGGAVEIQNSWGSDFGDHGYFWMKYEDFKNFCMEAYGLFPLVSTKADPNQSFKASLGLLINKSTDYISFKNRSGNVFETSQIIPSGTKFKVEITNSTPCYAYVIGQETDGSSYTLFPYTPKHSPFCGIVGTRIFPTDFSMQLDNVGTKDVMAILLTKNAIDIEQIKNAVSRNLSRTYAEKLKQVLGDALIEPSNLQFTTDQMINVDAGKTNKNVVAIVMEINKR